MKILYLQENELEAVKPILPESVLSGVVFVLAAVEEDVIKGVAVVQKLSGKQVALRWLYVLEKFRKQGVAGALLDFIIEETQKEKNGCLTAEYPAEEEEFSQIINHMLIKRDAELFSDLVRTGTIDRGGIFASKLAELTFAEEATGDLYALEEVSAELIQAFVKEHHLSSFSTEDLVSADKLLSVVYGVEGKMAGYILVAPDGGEAPESGEYLITGLYLDDKYRTHFVNFLRQAFIYLFVTDDLVKQISFNVYDEKIYALINKLLGEHVEWTGYEVIRGIVRENYV